MSSLVEKKIFIGKEGAEKDVTVEDLFKTYFTPLVLFSKTYTENIEISKDIVQDIFCTLLEKEKLFTSINNFKAYLYNAARNKSLNCLRHNQVKYKFVQFTPSEMNGENTSFWDKVVEEEVYSHLMNAVNELPPQCKKVYLLALEGKKNKEIADILNLSLETVKAYKKNGKKLLASRLKELIVVLEILISSL